MEIFLLRHGKPDIPPLDGVSPLTFGCWIQAYNAAGLDQQEIASQQALNNAAQCRVIVCSALKRSLESARALEAEKIILSDPVFNEAGLPFGKRSWPKLSPQLWAIYYRILWLIGYFSGSESYEQTKIRAKTATRQLHDLALKHKSVLLVGHGVFNRMLARELRNLGWQGPSSPGTDYWHAGCYRYNG